MRQLIGLLMMMGLMVRVVGCGKVSPTGQTSEDSDWPLVFKVGPTEQTREDSDWPLVFPEFAPDSGVVLFAPDSGVVLTEENLLIGVWGWVKWDSNVDSNQRSTLTFYEDGTYKRILLWERQDASLTARGRWEFRGSSQLILSQRSLSSWNWPVLWRFDRTQILTKTFGYTLEGDNLTLVNPDGSRSYYMRN
jgi:hypothetical protein